MTSLVTGGAGFIGSNLVEKLVLLNHQVIVLDNLSSGRLSNLDKVKNKIKFIKVDLSKKKDLSKYFKKVDWVFHLAGIADVVSSINNPTNYFNSNVVGTMNVLEAAKKNNTKKLIYASSASCYGIPEKYPTNEKSRIDPQSPYALTKYLGEQLVMHWAKVYNMPNISLRFFNIYGPKSSPKNAYGSVFNIFLAQKLVKKPLTIVGSGEQTRDFLHVFDLVDAIIQAAKIGKSNEIYNVASGNEVTINSIAKKISENHVHVPERPGETHRSLGDISKIKSDLGWKPKILLEEGLKILLENINYWKDAKVCTPKNIEKSTKNWFKLLSKYKS